MIYRSPIRFLLETPAAGGGRLAWLAQGAPGVTWQSGEYYENNKIPPAWKINSQANDGDLARVLWERSEALLGLNGAP